MTAIQAGKDLFAAARLVLYRRRVKVSRFLRETLPLEIRMWQRALAARPLLFAARRDHADEYTATANPDPLISVNIGTYNRAAILVERTIPSILAQTYQNFEIVIVGDCCTDDTASRVAALNDPRIRFINLPQRGPYPDDPTLLWYVAGTGPMNCALEESRGLWIAHLDDDDVWKPQHLEHLLRHAQHHDCEVVWSKMSSEKTPGEWIAYDRSRVYVFGEQSVNHSAVMFRSYLRLFRYDPDTWKIPTPGDRNLFMRMARAGVRHGFVDELTALQPLRPGVTRFGVGAEDRVTL
jgi:hypothetical protein